MWWTISSKAGNRTQERVSGIKLNSCSQECYHDKNPAKEENASHELWNGVEKS